jgi:hypothetical protein
MMHVTISRSFVARFGHVANHVLSSVALAKALSTAAAGLALPPLGCGLLGSELVPTLFPVPQIQT